MSESGPKDDGNVIQVRIAFDMKTNTITLSSKAPAVLLFGILEQAKATVIQKQIEAQAALASMKIATPSPAEIAKVA